MFRVRFPSKIKVLSTVNIFVLIHYMTNIIWILKMYSLFEDIKPLSNSIYPL